LLIFSVDFAPVAFYYRGALCLEDTELIPPVPDKPKTNNCSFSGFLSTKQKELGNAYPLLLGFLALL